MRTAFVISALLSLAVAAPHPQEFDWDVIESANQPDSSGPAVDSVSEPPVYSPSEEAASVAADTYATLADPVKHKTKRGVNDDCAPQPDGYGPTPPEDNVAAFNAYSLFASTSQNAATPHGYTRNFVNLNASSNANTYLGLYTLETYDTQKCSELCDKVSVCRAFNIYFERDPTVKPAAACPNPPSFTNIKCTLWGSNVNTASAQNKGQYRRDFQVVITGSNGYTKPNPPSPIPGYTGPVTFGCAINAPLANDGTNTYMGQKYIPGPYDAGLCAAACNTTTAYDHRHPNADGSYRACNFFNAYLLSIDGVPDGTACSLYTQPWAKDYATNCNQYRDPKQYTVDNSYGFSLSQQDSGHV